MNATPAPRVLLVRPDANEADARALRAAGFEPWIDPYLQIRPTDDPGGARELLTDLVGWTRSATDGSSAADRPGWLVVASPRAYPAWAAAVGPDELGAAVAAAAGGGLRAAAVGAKTAESLPGVQWPMPPLVAARPSAAGLLAELGEFPAGVAFLPRSQIGREELVAGLGELGWEVHAQAVYTTVTVTEVPSSSPAVASGAVAAVVLRSPSAVRALVEFARPPAGVLLLAVGPMTTRAAQQLGLAVLTCHGTAAEDVADVLASALAPGERPG